MASYDGVRIRSVESNTQDVFIDVNDLIIDTMLAAEKADSEEEKRVYKRLIKRLTDLRERGHATRKDK